jgi:hypothetical protein
MMRDFEPADSFVPRVMEAVHAYEASRRLDTASKEALFLSRPLRYALSGGGVLLAIVNIVRMASTFIAPALCR